MMLYTRLLRQDLLKIAQIKTNALSCQVENAVHEAKVTQIANEGLDVSSMMRHIPLTSPLHAVYRESQRLCRLLPRKSKPPTPDGVNNNLNKSLIYFVNPDNALMSTPFNFYDSPKSRISNVEKRNTADGHTVDNLNTDNSKSLVDMYQMALEIDILLGLNYQNSSVKNVVETHSFTGDLGPPQNDLELDLGELIANHQFDKNLDNFNLDSCLEKSNPLEKDLKLNKISHVWPAENCDTMTSTSTSSHHDKHINNNCASYINDMYRIISGDFYDDDVVSRENYQVTMGDAGVIGSPKPELQLRFAKTTGVGSLSDHCYAATGADKMAPDGPEMPVKAPQDSKDSKPNIDQLNHMQDKLIEQLHQLFSKKHHYNLYTVDVVLENNYPEQAYTTVGVIPYAKNLAKLRVYVHVKYATVRLELIRSTVHLEEGCVKIRWSLKGIPQIEAFKFWKWLPFKWAQTKSYIYDQAADGISTFYINGNGVIYKHRIDRVIAEESKAVDPDTFNLEVGAG